MRKAKVGIYNPLMWKEECWDNSQLDSSEATSFKDLNPRFDGGFSKNYLKCLFRWCLCIVMCFHSFFFPNFLMSFGALFLKVPSDFQTRLNVETFSRSFWSIFLATFQTFAWSESQGQKTPSGPSRNGISLVKLCQICTDFAIYLFFWIWSSFRRFSCQVVAVCDPLDRFERKMDLEVVRKGGNAEGREFLKLVTEFIESEARQNFPCKKLPENFSSNMGQVSLGCLVAVSEWNSSLGDRSIYFQIPVASWVKNYGHQILLIEKDWFCMEENRGQQINGPVEMIWSPNISGT